MDYEVIIVDEEWNITSHDLATRTDVENFIAEFRSREGDLKSSTSGLTFSIYKN